MKKIQKRVRGVNPEMLESQNESKKHTTDEERKQKGVRKSTVATKI